MKHFSHLNSAVAIIESYKGAQPFHLYIKDFFKQDKKYGSKDRKQITHLCYCYFRLGVSASKKSLPESIVEGLFLCSDSANELLATLHPAWNEQASLSFAEKCALLETTSDSLKIFPFPEALSNDIDKAAFNASHVIQPGVFVRVRPGYLDVVTNKLHSAEIIFNKMGNNCIRLSSGTKTQDLLLLNKEVVIQDYSSQQTASFMALADHLQKPISVWDCCAASGGKSILAKDVLGHIALTVSDIRPAILENLKKRLAEANISGYKMVQADLSQPLKTKLPLFDFIITDVPCSGSGTWGRTPENLSYFREQSIDTFQQLQQKIVRTAIGQLKQGGYLLYITCSAFKKENEMVADFISAELGVILIKQEVLKGYTQQADTMFAALFVKK